ncbi:MAG: DJ-1/PfpI family protein [Blastocatellia bacterium]|nr:DJ-1/PfpI family protein [Blastocatellia bacterium]
MERKKVGILVFPNVEVLDFCGPFEVFSVVRLDEEKRRVEPSPFEVFLVAESLEVVTAANGLKVVPDYTIDNCPILDILVVPGGWGVRAAIENSKIVDWVAKQGKAVETLTSVCTGSVLLGRAGLLEGKRATTHWMVLDWMRQLLPNVIVEKDFRYVEDGDIITSAGISAGIDMSLRVVSRYHGEEIARTTAKYMEYPFPENNKR